MRLLASVSRAASAGDTIGAAASRGARRISPGTGASKPSPTARNRSIAKLTHRICRGVSGAPPAMSKIAAPKKVRMKPPSITGWTRTYFMRLS